jgi:hypothetical protein
MQTRPQQENFGQDVARVRSPRATKVPASGIAGDVYPFLSGDSQILWLAGFLFCTEKGYKVAMEAE